MAQERVQKQKTSTGTAHTDEASTEVANVQDAELSQATEDTLANIDDVLEEQTDEELLADIDDLLEENAEEFVAAFVQQGGE